MASGASLKLEELKELQLTRGPFAVYLVNGIKLSGLRLLNFDEQVIRVESAGGGIQLLEQRCISTYVLSPANTTTTKETS